MRLSAQLYSRTQGEREPAAVFLEQKHLLARRLLPDASEQHLIALMIESLRGSLRKLLRTSTFQSVQDFIARTMQLEQDEADERQHYKTVSSANSSSQKNTTPATTSTSANTTSSEKNISSNSQRRSEREPPKCRFCPETHWHRDCPVKNATPSGNWRGTETTAAAPVPQESRP